MVYKSLTTSPPFGYKSYRNGVLGIHEVIDIVPVLLEIGDVRLCAGAKA